MPLLVLLGACLFFIWPPSCVHMKTKDDLVEIEIGNDHLKERIEKLESEIKALHTDRGLEHAIRDDLGWVRKDKKELIIVFEEPS